MTDREIIQNREQIDSLSNSELSPQKKTYINQILRSKNAEYLIQKIESGEKSLHWGWRKATGHKRTITFTKKRKKVFGKSICKMIAELENKKNHTFKLDQTFALRLNPYIDFLISTFDKGYIDELHFAKALTLLNLIDHRALNNYPEIEKKYSFLEFDEIALRNLLKGKKRISSFLEKR